MAELTAQEKLEKLQQEHEELLNQRERDGRNGARTQPSMRSRVTLDMGQREFDVTDGGALVCDSENAVIIVLPKTLKPKPSASGKADLYASTRGSVAVAGGLKVAANLYRSVGKGKATPQAIDFDNLF